MRNADEITTLVLNFARSEAKVRAVLLNGSRANPHLQPDEFQDFDVVFIVDDLESFTADHSWTDFLGRKIVSQMPEEMNLGDNSLQDKSAGFSYLMLFEDGNRIDLTLFPKIHLETDFHRDSLTVVWLDKDNLFSDLPPTGDTDYWIRKPAQKEFADVCNEFWWVSTYVVKGLMRNEITYAKEMLETIVRPMFMKMVGWKIGIDNDFSVNIGKAGKFIENYLSEDFYQDVLQTYGNADIEENWKALFKMAELFHNLATDIAQKLNFQYNESEQEKTHAYLKRQYQNRMEKN